MEMNVFTPLKPLPKTNFPSFHIQRDQLKVVGCYCNTIVPNSQFGLCNCYRFNQFHLCVLDTTRWFRYKCTFNHKDLNARTTFHGQERNSSEIERIVTVHWKKLQGGTWEKSIKSFDCSKKEGSDQLTVAWTVWSLGP